ncbi:MAG: hypothetical protein N2Z65_00320 [Clostridiales bacterium]|nr:hypothetical protein [Clostridiales bacterium]
MYIKNPNLPQKKVTSAILGGKYCELFEKPLLDLGVQILPVSPCSDVKGEERHHADMLVHHLGKNVIAAHKNMLSKDISLYTSKGLHVLKSELPLQLEYPKNIILNGLRIANTFFHYLKYTDNVLKFYLMENNCKMISVKQGYSKCAVAIVDENSVITSDKGMAKEMQNAGFDVLFIRPGFIRLGETDSGFIGGCSVKLSHNILAFTGQLTEHPDKEIILNYLISKNIKPIFLSQNKLFDVGSILPITEEDAS